MLSGEVLSHMNALIGRCEALIRARGFGSATFGGYEGGGFVIVAGETPQGGYGVNVSHHGLDVFRVEWLPPNSATRIRLFERGPWEAELLSLAGYHA